jgi:hypothetical protein
VVTNTHNVYKKDIEVTKVWNDNNNQDGIRPESITVKLLADGVDIATATLSEANGWKATFGGLEVNKDGKAINYTIEEVAVDGMASCTTVRSRATSHAGRLHVMRERPIDVVGAFKRGAAAKLNLAFGVLAHERLFDERKIRRPLSPSIDSNAVGAHRAHLRAAAILRDA